MSDFFDNRRVNLRVVFNVSLLQDHSIQTTASWEQDNFLKKITIISMVEFSLNVGSAYFRAIVSRCFFGGAFSNLLLASYTCSQVNYSMVA